MVSLHKYSREKRRAAIFSSNTKEKMKRSYLIYCATNITNNKKYYGLTTYYPEIGECGQHGLLIRKKGHTKGNKCPYFYSALKRYGLENFKWKVIKKDISTIEKCNELEKFYIKKHNTNNKLYGYNLTSGGAAIPTSSKTLLEKRARIFYAYNKKTLKLIRAFENKKTASETLNVYRQGITSNLSGRVKSCGSFVFSYKKLSKKELLTQFPPKKPKSKRKSIFVYRLESIGNFDNVSVASKKLNLYKGKVYECLKKSNIHKGFLFSYKPLSSSCNGFKSS